MVADYVRLDLTRALRPLVCLLVSNVVEWNTRANANDQKVAWLRPQVLSCASLRS